MIRRTVCTLLLSASTALAQPNEEDIRDIRGLLLHPNWQTVLLWTFLGLLFLGLLTWLIRWWMKRRKAQALLTLEQTSLARLDAAHALIVRDMPREFSIEVSETIRNYIEKRFNIEATHLTTEEFLRHVLSQPSSLQEQSALLGNFLQLCDFAKFAQGQLSQPQMENMFSLAKHFISLSTQAAQETKT